MNECNDEIHISLVDIGKISCPFCNEKLEDDEKLQDCLVKERDLCCDCQDIINYNGMLVCRSCGIVQKYESSTEYVDFYENRHKMKRKSVYHRKYHINNVLLEISSSHNITFSVQQKYKIMRIFSEIDKILPQINKKRKRIISIKFIIKKILKRMKLSHSYVKVTKSKRTKTTYQHYWNQIILLIGDKIKRIINE